MQKIGDVPCKCSECDWRGAIEECKPDVGIVGDLACPECGADCVTIVGLPQFSGFEAVLRRLCDWRVLAVVVAVIIAIDTALSGDVRNWAMLFVAVGMGASAIAQWETMRRQGVIIKALEQLLGPDLDGAAHPEMAGALERLRKWFAEVRQC